MRLRLRKIINDILRDEYSLENENFSIDIPKEKKFGDYSTNVAMVISKKLKKNPKEIAEEFIKKISNKLKYLEKLEIAGPGFINFYFNDNAWIEVLKEIFEKEEDYYKFNIGNGKKVLLEFVSANPTGPLHIGHGRGACIGDVLARVLNFSGFNVLKEYYINDAGNQMKILGESIKFRCLELLKRVKSESFPENYYKGEYIIDIAKELIDKYGDKVVEKGISFFTEFGLKKIMPEIIEDLERFRVKFDNFFSEKSLFSSGEVDKTIEFLKNKGIIYFKDNAWWLKVEGDEDRVVIKSDGSYTYLASDIAYHKNKYERGFDILINIWGADHHGYIPRIKSAVKSLGFDENRLKIILVQMVNLLRGGKKVTLSTRKGEFVTLREVLDEVGVDASRFIFMTRKSDAHLDFDLETAKLKSNENPVYYVQYAHARICSILKNCDIDGVITTLTTDLDKELIKKVDDLKYIIFISSKNFEPHLITYYLIDLAGTFHSYYNKYRIIGNKTRIALVKCVKNALKVGLDLLGVSAPERM